MVFYSAHLHKIYVTGLCRSLFSHKLSEAGNKFQSTCRANLNFVNKTKVEFQFAQFVTKQGAVTVHGCRAKTSLRGRERRHFARDGA